MIIDTRSLADNCAHTLHSACANVGELTIPLSPHITNDKLWFGEVTIVVWNKRRWAWPIVTLSGHGPQLRMGADHGVTI